MFDSAVIILRWLQMTGAMVLFGSSLFCLYAVPRADPGVVIDLGWVRPVLLASAGLVLAGSVLGLFFQTVVLSGSMHDALQPDALIAAITGMSFGKSSCVRASAALSFLALSPFLKPGRSTWWTAATIGAVICASFAWMGHGAATKGPFGLIHLLSDIVHTLAAGVWIGALFAFLLLAAFDGRRSAVGRTVLYQALHEFSGLGSGLVAVLVATGMINGLFVTGWPGLPRLLSTAYGQLLAFKITLFLAMVGLAALNRFRLTPRLKEGLNDPRSRRAAVLALRNSLVVETGLSFAVLALVAWFGMLAPPAAL